MFLVTYQTHKKLIAILVMHLCVCVWGVGMCVGDGGGVWGQE